MGKAKTDTAAKPKAEVAAELQIRASLLKSLTVAFKNVGFTNSGGVLLEFYKNGILLRMESKDEILAAIAIHKRALPAYNYGDGQFKTVLDHDTIQKMKGWSEGKRESIPIYLKFLENTITMKYENVTSRTKHQYFEDVQTKIDNLTKRTAESLSIMAELGTFNAEELVFIVDRIAKLKSDEYAPDYSRLEAEGDELTYLRVLGDADSETVEATLKSTAPAAKGKDKKQTTKYRSLYETEALANLMSGFCKLTKEVNIKGGTEKPIALTGAGTTPDELIKFENDIEYFVMLAPRVEGN